MSNAPVAKAYPHKTFFVEMFTRDITLEECLLDLIDNAIDGLIRTEGIELGKTLLAVQNVADNRDLRKVTLHISEKSVEVVDNCGGIPLKEAREEVFNFGHSPKYHAAEKKARLGTYGVGLKRALFKLGTKFEITSRTRSDGFRLNVDLDQWVQNDSLNSWTFPLEVIEAARSDKTAGTTIKITSLRESAKSTIRDGQFFANLQKEVGRAYALFLDRYVNVAANDRPIPPIQIPFGASDEIVPAFKELTDDGVTVHLFASLAKRDAKKEWPGEQAGWYVACNGRLVVAADQSELTGWNAGLLPEFHTGKYRGFVGLALFASDDPLKLPWTTKKSGLDKENMVYQRVRHEMAAITRPILTFLNKMYARDVPEEPAQRAIADAVEFVDVRSLAKGTQTPFDVKPRTRRQEKTTVRVQYDVLRNEVEKIKHHLRRPDMSSSAVGEFTFKDYIKRNGLQ